MIVPRPAGASCWTETTWRELRALAGGRRVENVDDVVSVGQKLQVEIGEIDDRGKLSLVAVVEEDDSAAASGPAESVAPGSPPTDAPASATVSADTASPESDDVIV